MEIEKSKKSLIYKTSERCRSIKKSSKKSIFSSESRINSIESNSDERIERYRIAPEGCFNVYVGAEKQRFVVRAKSANHPLFQMLLEEAESEFGYSSEGPLVFPCTVEYFNQILWKMENEDPVRNRCGFSVVHTGYRLLSPARIPFKRM